VTTATRALTAPLARADDRARVAAVVAVAFVVLALVAHGAPGPRIFPDEVIYMDAASSLAHGDGLAVRDGDYGYGPLYPVLVAPLVRLGGDREAAFALVQVLNSLVFALVAVPAFHLARRVSGPGFALVAAALSVLVPSSVYAAGVLTESVAYLAFACALLAIVRAVEEPTVVRQVAALGTVAAAALVRTQFLLLVPVLATSVALAVVVLPTSARPAWRRLWPTAAVLGAGVAIVLALLAGGRSPADLLGSYGVLWTSYDVTDLAGWFMDHLGLLVLYLAVVPAVVAPVELLRWWREARAGSRAHAALVSAFVTTNLALLAVVAAFASTSYAVNGLHDRSLFYVAPLWFAVLCGWLDAGMARPVAGLVVGGVFALGLVAQLPYRYVRDILWEMLALEPWAFVERGNPSGSPFSGREAMLGFVVVGVAAAAFVPRASRWVVVAFVGVALAFTGSLAWAHAREGARSVDAAAFDPGAAKAWVDDALPGGARALLLSVPSRCGEDGARTAMRATEFYDDAIGPGAAVGPADPLAPPSQRVAFRAGRLVDAASDVPVRAGYVVVRQGVELEGRRVASGTRTPLVAWATDGTVRIAGAVEGLPCES